MDLTLKEKYPITAYSEGLNRFTFNFFVVWDLCVCVDEWWWFFCLWVFLVGWFWDFLQLVYGIIRKLFYFVFHLCSNYWGSFSLLNPYLLGTILTRLDYFFAILLKIWNCLNSHSCIFCFGR